MGFLDRVRKKLGISASKPVSSQHPKDSLPHKQYFKSPEENNPYNAREKMFRVYYQRLNAIEHPANEETLARLLILRSNFGATNLKQVSITGEGERLYREKGLETTLKNVNAVLQRLGNPGAGVVIYGGMQKQKETFSYYPLGQPHSKSSS